MVAAGHPYESCSSKAPPPLPPNRLRTCFVDIAETTHSRCEELSRMTDPDMMKSAARAKAKSRGTNTALDLCADVPHDAIIGDDHATQWHNRYSTTSLRWPMFDLTSLLSWVWGLPMVVPKKSSGFRCGGLYLLVDRLFDPHVLSGRGCFVLCFVFASSSLRPSSSLSSLTAWIRRQVITDLTCDLYSELSSSTSLLVHLLILSVQWGMKSFSLWRGRCSPRFPRLFTRRSSQASSNMLRMLWLLSFLAQSVCSLSTPSQFLLF